MPSSSSSSSTNFMATQVGNKTSGLQYRSVFNARLKVCSDINEVIAGGSMFQTLAAATGKARSPMVFVQRPWKLQQRCQ